MHTYDFIVDIWDGQLRNRLDSMTVIAGANVLLLLSVFVIILGVRQLRHGGKLPTALRAPDCFRDRDQFELIPVVRQFSPLIQIVQAAKCLFVLGRREFDPLRT